MPVWWSSYSKYHFMKGDWEARFLLKCSQKDLYLYGTVKFILSTSTTKVISDKAGFMSLLYRCLVGCYHTAFFPSLLAEYGLDRELGTVQRLNFAVLDSISKEYVCRV